MPFKSIKLNDRLITSLMLAAIAALIAYGGALVRFDNLYYDLGRHLSFKTEPSDIVIIAVDEASLKQIGRWPWPRDVYARMIDIVSAEKPKAIGLDIIFSDPDPNNPQADVELVRAIERAGNVVLPELLETAFSGAPVTKDQSLDNIAKSAAALGRVHVPLDGDNIARSVYLWEGQGAANLPLFAQSVLQVAHELPPQYSTRPPKIKASDSLLPPGQLRAYDKRKVNFLGPPGSFKRVSYAQVLSGDYPKDFFKNKIVLVGATAVGMGDVLPTPVSAYSQPMPGVEFHANVVEAMRHAKLIVEMPLWFSCLFCAFISIIPLLWLPRLSPFKSLLLITAYYFVVILIVIVLPRFLNIWIPPAGALCAILLAYPIWSWRKLESAHTYLDIELQNLRNDLALFGVYQEAEVSSKEAKEAKDVKEVKELEDPLQARISKVRLTAEYLRGLHRTRYDTMAFISHDLRAPLATAMLLLKDIEKNKYTDRITQMLTRAHDMADNFLQASRAEMANVNKFQELDLVSLVQQVVDSAYETAAAKQVKIKTHFSESMLWINGDFGLLSRAIENGLSNAVKYSPENMTVDVELTANDNEVVLQIHDAGPGIPPERMARLFKRFSRAEGEQQAAEGTGLGLYFVEVTIKKHRGTINLTSVPNVRTSFIITLPRIEMPMSLR